MAYITTLLSQHALLTTLCQYLSTADIIDLGTTSRANHVYIHSSKNIFTRLVSNAECSGKGFVAHARVFDSFMGT